MDNKKLNEEELRKVTGGAEDHNVMLGSTFGEEVKAKCPYCFLYFPMSKLAEHQAHCSKNPANK